jgi:hypothetical protein
MVRGQEAAVVDTLTEGNAPRIASVHPVRGTQLGRRPACDSDALPSRHAGSAADIVSLAPHANFWAGAPDRVSSCRGR